MVFLIWVTIISRSNALGYDVFMFFFLWFLFYEARVSFLILIKVQTTILTKTHKYELIDGILEVLREKNSRFLQDLGKITKLDRFVFCWCVCLKIHIGFPKIGHSSFYNYSLIKMTLLKLSMYYTFVHFASNKSLRLSSTLNFIFRV